jgi:hypothetical protein
MTKARDIASATTPNANAALLATFPHRNLIINGAMQVAQRGTSAAGQTETSGYKTVDRFQFWTYSGGTYTLSQDSDAPDGFAYSHKVLNTSTTSTVAGTGVSFRHRVEAQDLQQLAYNTSAAKSVTLSFWVRSDTTGTYAIRLYNPDSTNIATKTYTISSANTWEKKEIVFSGDTGGVINNDNGYAFEFVWWLAAGTDFTSGSVTGVWEAYAATKEAVGQTVQLNTGGNWYITGVQLEVGEATPFEHRSFGDELAACQRYFHKLTDVSVDGAGTFGHLYNNDGAKRTIEMHYPQTMRTSPSLTTSCPNTIDTSYISPHGSTTVVSGVNVAYATYFTAFSADAEL